MDKVYIMLKNEKPYIEFVPINTENLMNNFNETLIIDPIKPLNNLGIIALYDKDNDEFENMFSSSLLSKTKLNVEKGLSGNILLGALEGENELTGLPQNVASKVVNHVILDIPEKEEKAEKEDFFVFLESDSLDINIIKTKEDLTKIISAFIKEPEIFSSMMLDHMLGFEVIVVMEGCYKDIQNIKYFNTLGNKIIDLGFPLHSAAQGNMILLKKDSNSEGLCYTGLSKEESERIAYLIRHI